MSNKDQSISISEFQINCRTCFSASDEQIPITKTIVDYFKTFLNFTIYKYEFLPNQICLNCYNALLESRRFYLQCREMETYFKMKFELANKPDDIEVENVCYIVEDDTDSNGSDSGSDIKQGQDYLLESDKEEIEFIECDFIENLDEETVSSKKTELICALNESVGEKESSSYNLLVFDNETISRNSISSPNNFTERSNSSNDNIEEEYLEEEHLKDSLPETDLNDLDSICQNQLDSPNQVLKTRPKTHKCTLCNRVFLTEKSLKRHFEADHKLTMDNKTCSKCRLEYDNEKEYFDHINGKVCLKKFSCEDCEKSFYSQIDLKIHQNIHTGKKPFECEVCKKRFRQKNTLKTHQTLHFGKTINCNLCDKKFARKSQLILHNRMHNNIKPFTCDQCPNAFRELQILNAHKVTHTGIRSFHCNLCPGKFYHKKALDQHFYSVHRLKNIICPLCNRTFNQNWRFRTHFEKVHKKRISDLQDSNIIHEDSVSG